MSALLVAALRVRRSAGLYFGQSFGQIGGEGDDGIRYIRSCARREGYRVTPIEHAAAYIVADVLGLLEPDDEHPLSLDVALVQLARLARMAA